MIKNVLLGFATVALAVASAAPSYTVTFFQPVTVNGTQLKPGDYKVEVKNDNMAVIKQGKIETEAPVKVQNESQKFSRSSVRIDGNQLEEIRVGGTTMRLVFDKPANATN
jgi:hypothetical protein